ncbi:hypothetical protein DFQ28_005395 [Apophysomyces sp. BC1034]|nr:hypothetical protein DFQ29_004844 [Apophysomyces sp. BC1021]KAG0193391.1 hypothetical protein DFQ28_005395 [Apophysomyces sp. BC1034]
MEDDSSPIQKAIRDLELDQLEKKYKLYFQRTSLSEAHRVIELLLPLANPLSRPLQLRLLIPYDYPDSPCAIQIQNHDISLDAKRHIQDAFEVHEWSQARHTTLVQQLDWLSIHTPTLLAQTR